MGKFNSLVFKAYDIRGVYPDEMNEEVAIRVAKAFAFLVGSDKIVIGRDARKSSPAIHKAVTETLLEMGVDVYDLGECCTPLLNYALATNSFKGGIMISASHNPSHYNALKLIKDGIQIYSPGDLDQVKKLAMNPDAIKPLGNGKGKIIPLSVIDSYVKEVSEHFIKVKGLKIVVDYGNGMGSITAKPVFNRLGLKVIPLFEEIDCSFPNHPANPMEEENLAEIRQRVVDEKADLGIAFDGDADRSFIIDDKGRILYPDILSSIIIPGELTGRSEKHVYYDLRFGRIIRDVLAQNRGIGVMMRVGNPFYKQKLKEDGGVFAAELTGHIMFQDHYRIDDGLYAALKVMKVAVAEKKKLSMLADPLFVYHSSPEINFKVKDADYAMRQARDAFNDGESLDLDGVYISYPDWWFSLRKSNTEPVVRLRLEADTKEKLDEMREKIIKIITS